MQHANFFSFKAKDNFELGLQIGAHFKEQVRAKIVAGERGSLRHTKRVRADQYLAVTEKYFPQYVEEMRGYAKGAEVDFKDLWVYSLEDELDYYRSDDHCTSVITNGGTLLSHNEDWAQDAANEIFIIQKTIGDLTILELNYLTTLGGNSASINSHGYVQLINTMTHSDWQMGAPRNVIARFMSETKDPTKDFEKLQQIPRSLGYNHNLISADGHIWNIECTSQRSIITSPAPPFVHTNHYLTELADLEATDSSSTHPRYDAAKALVRDHMTIAELEKLSGDVSNDSERSILNERTIARILIDLEKKIAKIWLFREADKGWVEYPLGFTKA